MDLFPSRQPGRGRRRWPSTMPAPVPELRESAGQQARGAPSAGSSQPDVEDRWPVMAGVQRPRVRSRLQVGVISLAGGAAEQMRDFHRRGGTVGRLMASTLLSASVGLGATVVLSCSADAEAARGAAPKLEQLPGRQGAVPPGASFLGPAPASTELPLVVTLQPRDPQGLAAEAQAVSDPSSPEYHHFLSPRQFAQRYGAASATIRQITQDLDAQGLTVGPASTTGLSLPVSGTAAHVQSAFSTTIDRYRLASGKTGLHNRSVPEVSAAIAPAIEGVIGLDTLSPPQPTTSPPEAAPAGAADRTAASTASPVVEPGQPSPVTGTCTSDIDLGEDDVRSTRRRRSCAGVLVRSGLRHGALRLGSDRRPRGAVGSGLQLVGHHDLRQLLRHHAGQRASQRGARRRRRSDWAPTPWKQSWTSRPCSPWPLRRTSRSTRGAPRTGSTTS